MSWIDKLDVEAVVGDVHAFDADAVVVPIKEGLVRYGNVAKALVARAPGFDDALTRARAQQLPMGIGDAHLFSADEIGSTGPPVIAVAFWRNENDYSVPILERAITGALRCAFAIGLRDWPSR